jgi:MFS family permease
MESAEVTSTPPSPVAAVPAGPTQRISKDQWRSGLAAWLGWTFDGLEMHIYTLVATPFVAQLLGGLATTDPEVGHHSALIQASFLLGWALGGGFFGQIGDRLGRARALCLTVLTYAVFTGLSFLAQRWWHLFIFRFIAALGVGGEWAIGASLLSETWPKKWRPWMAAVLQSGVNVGILVAALVNIILAKAPPRYLFLAGILPALFVLWIRQAVPEPEEWVSAKRNSIHTQPRIGALFSGEVRRISIWVMVVCAISLTAHWAFMFWSPQHLRNLPEVLNWTDAEKNKLVSKAIYLSIGSSILGNFFCGWLARLIGYRAAIGIAFLVYFFAMFGAYAVPRDHTVILNWLPVIGFCQGAFALFTMYLPPLFPTLLRTTGSGFCYNIGRIAASFGTVFFGLFSHVGDHRKVLLYASFLFLPAAICSMLMPRTQD